MRIRATTAALAMILAAATTVSAQLADTADATTLQARPIATAMQTMYPLDLSMAESAAHLDELQIWMREFSSWKLWLEEWSNRREPGWFTGYRQRRERPDPPAWLASRCEDSVDDIGAIAQACPLLVEWREDVATLQSAAARASATARDEQDDRTTWWEHLHLDFGWPSMQSKIYGVVGMHATTTVKGRLQVFVAPGAMLLNVPTRDGGRAWKVAANYGVAYRLGQFNWPGGRSALLHLNLAKAWLLDGGNDVARRSTDFVGFSITFDKTQ